MNETITKRFRRLAQRDVPMTPVQTISSAPTPEFQQHHKVRRPQVDRGTRRENYEVETRLQGLFNAHLIDHPTYQAGLRYRRDYDLGVEGVSDRGGMERVSGGSGGDGMTVGRLEALARHSAANDAVGPTGRLALGGCVVHDLGWRSADRLMKVRSGAAKAETILALVALLAHYDHADALHKQGSSRMRSVQVE